jgi:hypothetical protein
VVPSGVERMKRVIALYLYVCYKLETHYFFQVSLKSWLWGVIVAPPVLALLRRLSWPAAILVSVAGAALLAGTEWARRRHYTIFSPTPDDETAADANPSPAPIQVDEQVRCRACGLFAVGGKQRYVVNEDAQFSFVRTREHIVMACIRRTRFLLLAASLRKDVGWWYVFVTPERLQHVQHGTLSCGLRTHPALEVRYRPEQEPDRVEALYLAFEDVETRRRVRDDLRRDAPPQLSF